MNRITGIVIAGGKSSRMGSNKALVMYKGKRLVDNAIQVVQNYTETILISSNVSIPNTIFSIIPDDIKNIGPIGGLFSSLKASNTDINIVIPCDVPHIETNLYKILIDNSDNVDAVIPRLPNGKLEPLIACYNKSIIPIIEKSINSGDYKLVNLLQKLNVKYIDVANIKQFKNINTPTDL